MPNLTEQEPDVQVLDEPKLKETGFESVGAILNRMFVNLALHNDMLANKRTVRHDR